MKISLAAITGLATLASATSPITYCDPSSSGVCYSFAIPQSSSTSGTGDIFIQMTAPSSMSWVGLAQSASGTMAGANMLVAYASQNDSSVTISPRLGTGHKMPQYNSAASVSLLDGSSITNNTLTANIKCNSCNSWSGGSMALNDSSAGWIFAYAAASSSAAGIRSDNVSAPITMHQGYGSFKIDLSKAIVASSASNPFTGAALATTSASSTSSSSAVSAALRTHIANVRTAHGTILGLAFGALYPLGAILMRLCSAPNTWAIHAGIQMLAYVLSIAGMGMGIYVALQYDLLTSPHALIGFVVICLLFFMPVAGWIQHARFCKYKQRTWWGRGHAYMGRLLMILGIVNVGLGLLLTEPYGGESVVKGEIAYGVLGGVVGAMWVGIVVVTAVARRRKGGSKEQGGQRNAVESLGSGSSVRSSENNSPVDAEKHGVRAVEL